MELKSFQQNALDSLCKYLDELNQPNATLFSAWKTYWKEQDVAVGFGGVPEYKDELRGVPRVCLKIPTGGGKTFVACASLRRIFERMTSKKTRFIVWLVPSDTILEQTLKALKDTSHPYRLRLSMDLGTNVNVCSLEELLRGQNFSPDLVRETTLIAVLSYASLRISNLKKDARKAWLENGTLYRFELESERFENVDPTLSKAPETSLIQTMRRLRPIVIVDESHNAESDLSVEMLQNLEPSFVLELTATPRQHSNVIAYVDAYELKRENMVKLPVIVFNRKDRSEVLRDAIQLRRSLECQAIQSERTGGKYIRPIVLFQAQPKTKEGTDTFEQIKRKLIELDVSDQEIAIKTSSINELKDVSLTDRECKIRYIITVNALKEGWDCPFAYVLASLANKSSSVDVEQILGRVLRQPYACRADNKLLNCSYVLTSSDNFFSTLENIVVGLNRAGYSSKEYRIASSGVESSSESKPQLLPGFPLEMPSENSTSNKTTEAKEDSFDDFDVVTMCESLSGNIIESSFTNELEQASLGVDEYERNVKEAESNGYIGGELGAMLCQYKIHEMFINDLKSLKIPQFVYKAGIDLLGEREELLEFDALLSGIGLTDVDARINFESASEIYRIDLSEDGAGVPKFKRTSQKENEYFRASISTLPPERKLEECKRTLISRLNSIDHYSYKEIVQYVDRVIENMSSNEIDGMEAFILGYEEKIREKIRRAEDIWREKNFKRFVDSGKIVCGAGYAFPTIISPSAATTSFEKSLYEAEKDDMNTFERELILSIVALDNVKWFHRNIERKGFCLNGFINHYPDFIIMTQQDSLILVEAKGNFLANEDSMTKLKLGRYWQSLAQVCSNRTFRYFMVFPKNETGLADGAYSLDDFLETLRNL